MVAPVDWSSISFRLTGFCVREVATISAEKENEAQLRFFSEMEFVFTRKSSLIFFSFRRGTLSQESLEEEVVPTGKPLRNRPGGQEPEQSAALIGNDAPGCCQVVYLQRVKSDCELQCFKKVPV